MVIFVKITIFSKIIVKNGGFVGSEISSQCQKIFKKIIFSYIVLCSQSFVCIVFLVEQQYGALFDFQKWHPPFFFFKGFQTGLGVLSSKKGVVIKLEDRKCCSNFETNILYISLNHVR